MMSSCRFCLLLFFSFSSFLRATAFVTLSLLLLLLSNAIRHFFLLLTVLQLSSFPPSYIGLREFIFFFLFFFVVPVDSLIATANIFKQPPSDELLSQVAQRIEEKRYQQHRLRLQGRLPLCVGLGAGHRRCSR